MFANFTKKEILDFESLNNQQGKKDKDEGLDVSLSGNPKYAEGK